MNKYDEVLIKSAQLWAEQSYCEKAKVGAVLAKEGRILATGYNGTVNGLPNACETIEYSHDASFHFWCPVKKMYYRFKTSPFTVHAEQNVLMFCAKEGIATEGATIYITLSPCATCAKLMIQAGIKRVVYLEEYKDTSGIDFLETCGIIVEQYNDEI